MAWIACSFLIVLGIFMSYYKRISEAFAYIFYLNNFLRVCFQIISHKVHLCSQATLRSNSFLIFIVASLQNILVIDCQIILFCILFNILKKI